MRKLQRIRVPGVLGRGKWCHIAAVSSHTGMRLYLNGVLIGQHEYQGGFSAIPHGEDNYLGKAHWESNVDFQGQLDEIRIWNIPRTDEQIRATMHRKLRGNESGLVGLWNFDAGSAFDSSANDYDGILQGDAHCIPAELPSQKELACPAVLSGVITDEEGNLLTGANICLEHEKTLGLSDEVYRNPRRIETIAETTTDKAGNYRIFFYPTSNPYNLSATWNEKGDWKLMERFSPGKHYTLNFTLKQAVSISGILLAHDGTFHTGVSVQAVHMDNNELSNKRIGMIHRTESTILNSQVVATTLSEENGEYRFINLEPGR